MKALFSIGLFLSFFGSYAQYNSYGFGAGTSFFRGETTATSTLFQEPGVNLYAFYNYWLPQDQRFQASSSLIIDYNNPNIQQADLAQAYEAHCIMLSPMVGMRYYHDSYLSDYVPEKFQRAVFLGLHMGPTLYYVDYPGELYSQSPSDAYQEGLGLSFTAMAELGYRIYINQFWSYEISTGFKYGFMDRWDGYRGSTGINDWLFHLNVGMSYSFY